MQKGRFASCPYDNTSRGDASQRSELGLSRGAERIDSPLKPSRQPILGVCKNRHVTFEPREVALLRPQTSTEMGLTEFVRLEGPLFFETSYCAVPGPGGEKPYAHLYRSLSEIRYASIGSLAMLGREYSTVIHPGRWGLNLHTFYYANK